ncbi:MAG TPA: hypothetical protein VHE53_00455 [Patescibacteria group bacterium]|nr:hypothetical protein [Patescibacteria group bacterium]
MIREVDIVNQKGFKAFLKHELEDSRVSYRWKKLIETKIVESGEANLGLRFWRPYLDGRNQSGNYIQIVRREEFDMVFIYPKFFTDELNKQGSPRVLIVGEDLTQFRRGYEDYDWYKDPITDEKAQTTFNLIADSAPFTSGGTRFWWGGTPDVSGVLRLIAEDQGRTIQRTGLVAS